LTATWFCEACTASCCSDDSCPRGLEDAAALNSLHKTQMHHASMLTDYIIHGMKIIPTVVPIDTVTTSALVLRQKGENIHWTCRVLILVSQFGYTLLGQTERQTDGWIDEERMRQSHWIGQCFAFPPSAPIHSSVPHNPKDSLPKQAEEIPRVTSKSRFSRKQPSKRQ